MSGTESTWQQGSSSSYSPLKIVYAGRCERPLAVTALEHSAGSQFHSSENKHTIGAHLSPLMKSAVGWAEEEKKRKAEIRKPSHTLSLVTSCLACSFETDSYKSDAASTSI